MTLLEKVVDAIWGGLEAQDPQYTNRIMRGIDIFDVDMDAVAKHVIDKLGLEKQ